MDFYQIGTKETKSGIELFPDFTIGRSKDLMVQGRTFYAIWDEERGLWSRDEYDVQRLVDEELEQEAARLSHRTGIDYQIKYMRSFGSRSWAQFRKFLAHISDNSHPLDSKLIFANQLVEKTDYATKRLPYDLVEGDTPAWDELVGTLYSTQERQKIEWAIGSIIAGDGKKIQKFVVFYGSAGTGKSTILNIIENLFVGYTTTFDGKALGNSNSSFATEMFRNNPLVAIQHDGDLSRLEDNTRLNSIVSHEMMTMNEKYKPSYTARAEAFLFMGSNQPVKITDAKSGIIRRLIDVHPTGVKIPPRHYNTLLSQIEFELGAIAHKCLQVYLEMGKNYYNGYRPLEMMLQTDIFFNFVEAYYDEFKKGAITLKQAYAWYKEWCNDSGIERPLPQYKMREELRNYFDEFRDRGELMGEPVRSLYLGFNADRFKEPSKKDESVFSLVMEEETSLLDEVLAGELAQLATEDGKPKKPWSEVKTTLAAIDTHALHYVKVPEKMIVIDFDLKDLNGTKALERNLEAASQWPATYAELSKSGKGVHLHYTYEGDSTQLVSEYSEGIEIKSFHGGSALRRRLTKCNAVPLATLSSGLPLKKKETVLKDKTIKSEKGLRELIERNLRKEIHPGTKPSVDFIKKVLDDAHESGMKYDVTDLRPRITAFASSSSNQSNIALKVVSTMKFSSEKELTSDDVDTTDGRLVFFDVEVYSNLFVICWKYQGAPEVVKMINPKASEVEGLFQYKLVGFYNRRYDNHILWAASLGFSIEQLFKLSQKLIVDGNRNATFGQAYNLSYADIWDVSNGESRKSLKKHEIDLGIHHMELDIPWDKPVDKKDWPRVVEYCANDVIATEAVFNDRAADFTARKILAELSGLTVNDTTQRHTAKIIFGDDKNPSSSFVYTDLSKQFPGYEFRLGKSYYKGEEPGEGGYVYAEPGIYQDVAVLDIASMHPSSIEILNLFGKYTPKFSELIKARVAIKRRDFDVARNVFDGKLAPFLEDEDQADKLAYALKIVINIVYGLTSAKFDNPFRDIRNKDNIVAKRGALYMIDLKEIVQKKGYTVAHIKTDSIKIPNADSDIISYIQADGTLHGYDFEHETTYDKFCLVNDAVYVARTDDKWVAVGAQFQHPYVFKTLFSKEKVEFSDYCEGRSVQKGAMYLGKDGEDVPTIEDCRHVGKTGLFVPVLKGGRRLYRFNEDKFYAVSGTKGYLWMEAEIAKDQKDLQIDMSYFEKLKDDAIKAIEKFGSFEEFVS